MRTTSLLMLGAAPGALAVGYFLLTGYLLNRVRPMPIAIMPRARDVKTRDTAQTYAITPRRTLAAVHS